MNFRGGCRSNCCGCVPSHAPSFRRSRPLMWWACRGSSCHVQARGPALCRVPVWSLVDVRSPPRPLNKTARSPRPLEGVDPGANEGGARVSQRTTSSGPSVMCRVSHGPASSCAPALLTPQGGKGGVRPGCTFIKQMVGKQHRCWGAPRRESVCARQGCCVSSLTTTRCI